MVVVVVVVRKWWRRTNQLKSALESALDSADQVEAMHIQSQASLAKADAAVEELKALLKEAIANRNVCREQANEHATILNDASSQVEGLVKEYGELDSRRFAMQTRRSEAEARLQKIQAEWTKLKADLRPVGASTQPAAVGPVVPPIAPAPTTLTEEAPDDEVERLCQEADRGEDIVVVASLGNEFQLPILEPTEAAEAASEGGA